MCDADIVAYCERGGCINVASFLNGYMVAYEQAFRVSDCYIGCDIYVCSYVCSHFAQEVDAEFAPVVAATKGACKHIAKFVDIHLELLSEGILGEEPVSETCDAFGQGGGWRVAGGGLEFGGVGECGVDIAGLHGIHLEFSLFMEASLHDVNEIHKLHG